MMGCATSSAQVILNRGRQAGRLRIAATLNLHASLPEAKGFIPIQMHEVLLEDIDKPSRIRGAGNRSRLSYSAKISWGVPFIFMYAELTQSFQPSKIDISNRFCSCTLQWRILETSIWFHLGFFWYNEACELDLTVKEKMGRLCSLVFSCFRQHAFVCSPASYQPRPCVFKLVSARFCRQFIPWPCVPRIQYSFLSLWNITFHVFCFKTFHITFILTSSGNLVFLFLQSLKRSSGSSFHWNMFDNFKLGLQRIKTKSF